MEKQIVRWAYLLCLVSFGVALVWRGLTAVGVGIPAAVTAGQTVYYTSFYKAGLMFALIAIATSSYASAMKQ